jgi:branched-chain amino acid transport system substrate-binding protein
MHQCIPLRCAGKEERAALSPQGVISFCLECIMQETTSKLRLIRRRSLIKPAIAAVAYFSSLPYVALAQAEKNLPIRLGQSAPISGPLAKSATAFRDTAKAVFKQVNDNGGISGRSIELITLDDGGRSETTATNIKLLASQHQVLGLFGFIGPGAHRVGALAAQQEGLPFIAPVSGAPALRSGAMPWVYNLRAGHQDELQFIVKHAKQIGMNRIAMLYEYNSQGWELRDTFSSLTKAMTLNESALVSVDQEGSDFSINDAVIAVLNEKPQCIVLGADFAASGKFVDAARKAGFNGFFYALSTVGGQALMDQLGNARAAGISVTQVVPFPWGTNSEVGRAFAQFTARHKLLPSFEGMEAWLATSLLVDAMRKARSLTSAKQLIAELDKLPQRDFGSYVGTLSAKPAVLPYVDLTVYSRDGKFRA